MPFRPALIALCSLLLAVSSASADATVDLIVTSTTGSGVVPDTDVVAEVGDVLEIEAYLTAGPSWVETYSFSIDYSGEGASTANDVWTPNPQLGTAPFLFTIATGTHDPVADLVTTVGEACFTGLGCGLAPDNSRYVGTLEVEVTGCGIASPYFIPGIDGVIGLGGIDVTGTTILNDATWSLPDGCDTTTTTTSSTTTSTTTSSTTTTTTLPTARIAICHLSDDEGPPTTRTLRVNPSSVAAHLAHGDSLGACGR